MDARAPLVVAAAAALAGVAVLVASLHRERYRGDVNALLLALATGPSGRRLSCRHGGRTKLDP